MTGRSDPPTGPVALRERLRRRTVACAAAVLLLLGASPVYVHPVARASVTDALAGIDHLGTLCLTALHLLLLPVHRIVHLVALAGLAFAVWDRARAWRTGTRALALVGARRPAPGDPFWRASERAGIDPHRVRVATGLPNPAFTAGLLAPIIYLADALAARLSDDELVAVVAHEAAHVHRRDPLRLFVLRFVACTFFWIPALRRLAADIADDAEVLADDAAVRGQPLVLAAAILALAEWGATPAPAATVGFQRSGRHDDLLERRVRRLAGEDVPVRSHVTRRSLIGAATALALVWASGVIMAHPLPGPDHAIGAAHCRHHGESAIAHLFCLGTPFAPRASGTCPHGER